MTRVEKAALALLHRLDPERAHDLSLAALRLRLTPAPGPVTSTRLATCVGGVEMSNPVGLAAGYDKNARALPALMAAGFGFVEVGAATPRPQPGNPRPRLFRLAEDRAAINRYGFNNDGAEAIAARLAARPRGVPVGLNVGANRNSRDPTEDFARCLAVCGPHADFVTVNVSSPNTAGLRRLQSAVALRDVLSRVAEASVRFDLRVPVFLKISPDLGPTEVEDIAGVALEMGVSAIVATNTTLDRDGVRSRHANEAGGLSGSPLFDRSTRIAARLHAATGGRVPIIGVGGVASAEDALAKITAGASAVQLYTGLVYGGLSLATRIPRELDGLLSARGFASVAEAVGTDRDRWL